MSTESSTCDDDHFSGHGDEALHADDVGSSKASIQMPERIFITYTNATAIPYQGTTWAHHAVLNYIDSEGNHYTLEGVPERKFNRNVEKLLAALREEGFSNGANNTDSPFQRLKAEPRPVRRPTELFLDHIQ